MAQCTITLYAGHATPKTVVLRPVWTQAPQSQLVCYLYPASSRQSVSSQSSLITLRSGNVVPKTVVLYPVAQPPNLGQLIITLRRTSGESTSAPSETFFGVLKRWSGSSWVAEPLKSWVGGSWQLKPLKRWGGSGWLKVNTTGVT